MDNWQPRQTELFAKGTSGRSGGVYCMREANTYACKLGRSKNVEERLHKLGTGNSNTLELVWVVSTNNDVIIEAELHKKYVHCHKRDEWFELTPEQVIEAQNFANTFHPYRAVDGQDQLALDHCKRMLNKVEDEYDTLLESNPARAKSLRNSLLFQLPRFRVICEADYRINGERERKLNDWADGAIRAARAKLR